MKLRSLLRIKYKRLYKSYLLESTNLHTRLNMTFLASLNFYFKLNPFDEPLLGLVSALCKLQCSKEECKYCSLVKTFFAPKSSDQELGRLMAALCKSCLSIEESKYCD